MKLNTAALRDRARNQLTAATFADDFIAMRLADDVFVLCNRVDELEAANTRALEQMNAHDWDPLGAEETLRAVMEKKP
jgi:hypothetical protein